MACKKKVEQFWWDIFQRWCGRGSVCGDMGWWGRVQVCVTESVAMVTCFSCCTDSLESSSISTELTSLLSSSSLISSRTSRIWITPQVCSRVGQQRWSSALIFSFLIKQLFHSTKFFSRKLRNKNIINDEWRIYETLWKQDLTSKELIIFQINRNQSWELKIRKIKRG